MSLRPRTLTAAAIATVTASAALLAVAAPPGSSASEPAARPERQVADLEVGPAEAFSRFAFGHSLVVDRAGDATMIWTRSVSHPTVLTSHRPAGGDWGEWEAIGRGFSPTVEADDRGRVTAVWVTARNGLRSARRGLDGTWGPADQVKPPVAAGGPGALVGTDLAVAPDGRATTVWSATTGEPGSPRQLFWSVRPLGSGWGEPVPVGSPGRPESPQVAVAPGGVTTVMYGVRRAGSPRALAVRDHTPGQGWTPPTRLGRGGYSSELGVDGSGNAIVAFNPNLHRVDAVYRAAGGDWRRPRTLTPPRIDVGSFDLALNRAGDIIVAWTRGNGDVGASRRSATSPWTGPTVAGNTGRDNYFVSAAMSREADAFVAWGSFAVSAAHQPDGEEWSEPTAGISNRNLVLEDLRTTAAPDGSTVVVYKQEDTALRARDVRPVP